MMIPQDIQQFITNSKIKITGIRLHSKASEEYVDVKFSYADQDEWVGSVPYRYRRAALFLDSAQEIAKLIEEVYEAVKKENSIKWVEAEKEIWKKNHTGKEITAKFFEKLLNLQWNCIYDDFPANPNWARRIQDIKEMGYILATNTKRYNEKLGKNTTQILLLPFKRGIVTGYEVFSPSLRKRIIKVLGSYDAYEGKVRPSQLLLPDHKFPEISWDENTREKNPDDMSDEEIRAKFQLLDNQRNLEKREACRKVIQTKDFGTIFGIEYHMDGVAKWPDNIPMIGKESEKGWKYCPWYDIEAWRKSLNQSIKHKKK